MSAAVGRARLVVAPTAVLVLLIASQFSSPLPSKLLNRFAPALRHLQGIASTFSSPPQHVVAMAGNLAMDTPLLRLRDGNKVPMVSQPDLKNKSHVNVASADWPYLACFRYRHGMVQGARRP